ncbi:MULTISPECIES: hypothetical protein [Lachnospira]|uniref:Uncharacterized protein n=1 Tax=Lachnospira pectinoschiza TaxID=28052 RepID=A0A1G9TJ13_9FIRM|nr:MULTISPECIES: hypothetical protein [Lachnospira]SDM47727.1 hypothetical protein SAMN05216544_0375 [Lachnospira pectinoschiza]
MPRNINTHGGGSQTNVNGLSFEQGTLLNDALIALGYTISNHQVLDSNNSLCGLSVEKYKFYNNFLIPNNVNYKTYNSKKWLPDDCFINYKTKTVYIIEKKFQNSPGSVDEKLASCEFKKKEYEKLCNPINYSVEYLYVFNDWFKKEQYKDILEYIMEKGCNYFYNQIPLSFLGL